MGKTLYLECASGISGDMVVGSLLDLGANEAGLRRALDSLNVDGFEIAVTRKLVSGIDACDFDVVLDEVHESHDHDMDYLYGDLDGSSKHEHHHHHHHDDEEHGHDQDEKRSRKHKKKHKHAHRHEHDHVHENEHDHHHEHEHDHEHMHEHEHEHEHDHEHHHAHDHAHCHEHEHHHDHEHTHEHHHDHGHIHSHEHEHHHLHSHEHGHGHGHHHHHEHRSPADIAAIIDAADLAPRAKEMAHRIFGIVAQAEAKAHGLPLEEVHFHEVGAVDSIVDVVAVAYCLDDLDVTDAYVTALAEGHGRVRCAHGVLSVPVPAVTNIVAAHGLVLQPRDIEGELVTPTGAAIAAAVRTMDTPPAAYRVLRTGLGSGKRAYNPPSTVRALIIEENAEEPPAAVAEQQQLGMPHLWKLETELDDCTGEALGHVLQLLYDAGALEAHYLPVFMKKNRPGYQIEILCSSAKIGELERIVFENTTTIGIRRCPEWRTALPREARDVETPLGMVRVKVVTLPSGAQRAYPEHDSVAALAVNAHTSYQEALRVAIAAIEMEE